ncbi:hypothetical protein B0T14DRAFT_561205 [Immersiella caudata]|uniref:DUF3669 domain-containing protein n=1 Tax=Immersiella caudata TaxID=314043 RepID=A0AA39XGK4_9PEZI|nr:hypothetical protein B0T14DRAFT_561205 [Immersiella caudata]
MASPVDAHSIQNHPSSIFRDSLTHFTAIRATSNYTAPNTRGKAPIDILIPLLKAFYDEEGAAKTLWEAGHPEQDATSTMVVELERIYPLTKIARKALVEVFYEKGDWEQVLSSQGNEHYLVRPYLGRNRPRPVGKGVSVRNFPVYLEDVKKVGVDVGSLARELGKGYGAMHWGVGVNGDDVEFVFCTTLLQPDDASDPIRTTRIWLLDFGKCDVRNGSLWKHFSEGYMQVAETIIHVKGLSNRFSAQDFLREHEEYAEDILI